MREGDWNIVEGAFFDCWSESRHVLRPFEMPAHWMRFRSADWGSASPFSVGWWAVVSDDFAAENVMGRPLILPRGALVRYREWYGAKRDKSGKITPNAGLKLDNEEIGKGIVARETRTIDRDGKPVTLREEIAYGVLDPRCFAHEGGPSIAEAIFKGGAAFRPADNTRVREFGAAAGWGQMRSRMIGNADGQAMLYCFSTCLDSIRTIPVLQHDPDRPEDLDTTSEDHCADEWRYACNSRPWVSHVPKPAKARKIEVRPYTLNEIVEHTFRGGGPSRGKRI